MSYTLPTLFKVGKEGIEFWYFCAEGVEGFVQHGLLKNGLDKNLLLEDSDEEYFDIGDSDEEHYTAGIKVRKFLDTKYQDLLNTGWKHRRGLEEFLFNIPIKQ